MTQEDKEIVGMKTIEERAKEYVERLGGSVAAHCFGFGRSYRMAYEAGAKEQKAIDEAIRLKKCDAMTEAEYNREVAFIDWFYENSGGTITHSDAIEWARKEAIEEAASWFGDYLTELGDSVNWFCGSSKMKSGKDRFMEAMKK